MEMKKKRIYESFKRARKKLKKKVRGSIGKYPDIT